MNWSAGKIGTINQRSAHANGLSTPPIGCVLYLPGLPGGGTKIYDRSPYGNIGTITGAVWKRLPSGLWCLDFDGTDDYVNCGHNASLNITEEATIEMWIYPTAATAGTTRRMLSKAKFELNLIGEVTGANFTFLVKVGTVSKVASAPTDSATFNTWHHVVGVYNQTNVLIYQNTTLTTGDASTGSIDDNAADDLFIASRAALDRELTGSIGLVRIYNRALSALEIQNHFNRERHLFGVW